MCSEAFPTTLLSLLRLQPSDDFCDALPRHTPARQRAMHVASCPECVFP